MAPATGSAREWLHGSQRILVQCRMRNPSALFCGIRTPEVKKATVAYGLKSLSHVEFWGYHI